MRSKNNQYELAKYMWKLKEVRTIYKAEAPGNLHFIAMSVLGSIGIEPDLPENDIIVLGRLIIDNYCE